MRGEETGTAKMAGHCQYDSGAEVTRSPRVWWDCWGLNLLLQENFLTLGSNQQLLCLLHCTQILNHCIWGALRQHKVSKPAAVHIALIIYVLESSSSFLGRKATLHIFPTFSYHLSTQGVTTVRERCVCYEELASIPQPQRRRGKRELSFQYEFKVLKVMKLKN